MPEEKYGKDEVARRDAVSEARNAHIDSGSKKRFRTPPHLLLRKGNWTEWVEAPKEKAENDS